MPTPQQVEEAFRTVDEMRLDDFAALFTPDGTMTFGNSSPTPDPAGSRQALADFYSLLRAVRHEVLGAWIVDDVSINESIVHYTMRDGSVVSLPATSILRWSGDRIREWRIYMDVAPAVAAAQATSTA
ncbi:MAG TPA: nuclear transport factor 2 family protein [Candidatus Dormibacteraeota bacterium]|nr:nuclear transport factor 2 family protein [Candidatus Dormibacteraeota bacterium]